MFIVHYIPCSEKHLLTFLVGVFLAHSAVRDFVSAHDISSNSTPAHVKTFVRHYEATTITGSFVTVDTRDKSSEVVTEVRGGGNGSNCFFP